MSHTVLVCDDAIFMRTMISDILAQAGFEIVGEAETGSQAVEKYRQLKPDLVTMDIVMPDMGGIDAVREIVKHDPDAKIPLRREGPAHADRKAEAEFDVALKQIHAVELDRDLVGYTEATEFGFEQGPRLGLKSEQHQRVASNLFQ